MNTTNDSFRKLLVIIGAFFFFIITFPILSKAEIKYPYVVDEKSQVTFGDSIATSTYFGLENYTQDYVDGFAHITFTYTHSQCCFTNYPPLVYITNVDPRTTNTPVEKWSQPAYQIPALSGIPSDWYQYDIQFDENGFRVKVTQEGNLAEIFNSYFEAIGIEEGDWVALVNRHPDFAPGNTESMAFTPVTILENPPDDTPDPVIIIPGIMGSAKKNGELVIDPILHTYDDLIATLDQNGYTPEIDLFTFPYEWRDSNIISANLLRNKINDVKAVCNCSKVDLVAHSMGGLVAREYIQSMQYQYDIDQMIFLGTPHKGSPQAYLRWEAGEFENEILDQIIETFFKAEALRNGYLSLFSYIQNRPISSVQGLLPIFNYIKDNESGIVREYSNDYPRNIFLEALNTDDSLFRLLTSGAKITNIVGDNGENGTINIIRVREGSDPLWLHGKPDGFNGETLDRGLERGEGDGTVTTLGATLDISIPDEEITGNHIKLPTLAENRIYKILTNKDSTTNIDNYSFPNLKVLFLQLLSPVDFVVTAPDGKKIGKNFQNGSEFSEIPNAFYSGYQTDEEYITILNPLNGEYKIELQGTGSGGKYTVLSSYISEATSTTKEFISVTAPNQITQLGAKVDNSNPGNNSIKKKVTLEDVIADINNAYNSGWIKDKKTRDLLIKQAQGIVKIQKKIDIINKKKVERIEKVVDKILARLFIAELDVLLKKKIITQDAYKIIKEDIQNLINN